MAVTGEWIGKGRLERIHHEWKRKIKYLKAWKEIKSYHKFQGSRSYMFSSVLFLAAL